MVSLSNPFCVNYTIKRKDSGNSMYCIVVENIQNNVTVAKDLLGPRPLSFYCDFLVFYQGNNSHLKNEINWGFLLWDIAASDIETNTISMGARDQGGAEIFILISEEISSRTKMIVWAKDMDFQVSELSHKRGFDLTKIILRYQEMVE